MITKEKQELTDDLKESIITLLDSAYEASEPIAIAVKEIFDDYDVSNIERNSLILRSKYSEDADLAASISLFGFI